MVLPTTTALTPGLSSEAVLAARLAHGRNVLAAATRSGLLATLREVVTEPMFLLLLAACAVYIGLGEGAEAITLGVALLAVAGISVYQETRSNRALGALRELTQPRAQVRRNGLAASVPVEDLVVGDAVLVAEGARLPADGTVTELNDFSVDEAILTGEAVPVAKAVGDPVFAGTSTVAGSAWLTVTAVGTSTKLGRIGQSMQAIDTEKTPLQLQVRQFVLRMAWVGAGAFVLVWGVNFAHSGNWITALLFGLTLAMSILPEEIPVAFSSFMALGAARLSRLGVLTKQPQTVESLGSATVICADKTGTLTQEGMRVAQLYDGATASLVPLPGPLASTAAQVLACARYASETEPFDAMEQAIVAAFAAAAPAEAAAPSPMLHEYPLAGTPPMMTHVRQVNGRPLVAGKGAVEHVLAVCRPAPAMAEEIRRVARELSGQGYRVLGVARAAQAGPDFPAAQDDFAWEFLGLIALENPPKANAAAVIKKFLAAGIQVKMITGDFPETAQAIARQVGLPGADTLLTGEQVMALSPADLRPQAATTAVFARMFPEAKLKVVEALKANGEVVAMTGDGVNDGPALKAAHIGVAMGRRGTEVARQAASLVLVDDDLAGMVTAIAQGRRIYQNFKKAVFYVVSIHIPIVLTVTVPLLAAWQFANLFSPIHIIFLELVMGPTCSIAFENEPAEAGQMRQPPRPLTSTFLAGAELGRSVAQGLGIAAAVLAVYYVAMRQGAALPVVRTLTFATLVLSNLGLTLVSRSFTQSVLQTLRVPNRILWLMLGLTLALLLVTLFVPAAQRLFGFAPVSAGALGGCALAALVGVGWMEVYKAMLRSRTR
ncbi:cation-translocating P-type ATPase [Hymenobacter sp. UV11]|uniref:cation-translocating P-type ATPase n=1 Tax=Hymenobacter sp. UV11 TaxID=1849735 RepID=UPI00105E1116|nr:cation-translocating P-type ATPase [Hymenobacter sp. UV11]TDN38807.1 haloacid dehalogenase [Hymenobacter sp. UV11]TFZ63798.1 cation-translocating P-type ATPase [Hymenobacter sp. UV11]